MPMTFNRFLVSATFATAALAAPAHAVPANQQEVPNGGVFRCQTCHTRSGGGEGWNPFGIQILEAGGANPAANPNDQNNGFEGTPADYWFELCDLDADGDGATNAEELGDLDCDGVEDDGLVASNPGDPASVPDNPGSGGEGEGEGEDLGGCDATDSTSQAPLGALALGLLALFSARKRR